MKFILIAGAICFLSLNAEGQSREIILKSTVDYLRKNETEFADAWQRLVVSNSARIIDYKQVLSKGFKFKISDTIAYRTTFYFRDSIRLYGSPTEPDKEGNKEDGASRPNTFKDSILSTVVKDFGLDQQRDFMIGFSNPTGNFLIVEIWHSYFGTAYRTKFGDALLVLFLFNKDGSVKKTCFEYIIK